jgi:UDP-glucose 4-epimerase
VRVTVIGGTRFIGRRIVTDLVARGDEVQVVHRGQTEPPDLAPARHVHTERADFASVATEVSAFAPQAVIDTGAMNGSDADAVLPYLPRVALVVLSSMDVYRAFHLVRLDQEGEAVPFDEGGRLRDARHINRGLGLREEDEKLEVEPSYLERGATVLRLPMVYGEHDGQRREEFILRRVRAGRQRIPIGAGTWLWTRAYVGDVSTAVLACLANPAVAGEVLNIGEPAVRSMRGWAHEILAAAGHEAQLVTVPESLVPADLWPTKRVDQHLLVDCGKARRLLGWHPDPSAGLARSVSWHLAHPPADASDDFTADDAALAAS